MTKEVLPIEEMTPEQIEEEARSFGWTPEEEFRGNKEKWVPADEFVDRGRKLVPILNSNNKRLQAQLLTRDQKIDTLSQQLTAAQIAIEKLEKHYTESNRRQLEEQRVQLTARLKEARDSENVEDEVQILEQLGEVRKTLTEAKDQTPPAKSNQPVQPNADPELQAWMKENTWFGPDKKKTKLVTRIAEDLREDGNNLPTREFLEEVMRLYEKQYGKPDDSESEEEESSTPPQRRTPNKVEGASSARSPSSRSKSWESLPTEAKSACLEDVDDLVGPGKRYKTVDEWKKRYVEIYFGE